MKDVKKTYFALPLTLAILLLLTNLLSAKIFSSVSNHFSVWFVLLLFAFGIGWFVKNGFQWSKGAKIISYTIIFSVIISLILVAIFRNSFDVSNSFIENVVSYSLRVFVTGLFAFFGLTLSEVLSLKKESISHDGITISESNSKQEEALLLIKDAKLKAEKIIFDAEKDSQKLHEQKNRIENQLRELIQTEREVIRKYEKDEFIEDNKD